MSVFYRQIFESVSFVVMACIKILLHHFWLHNSLFIDLTIISFPFAIGCKLVVSGIDNYFFCNYPLILWHKEVLDYEAKCTEHLEGKS